MSGHALLTGDGSFLSDFRLADQPHFHSEIFLAEPRFFVAVGPSRRRYESNA